MATNLSFAAQVDAWVAQTDQRMEAVFKESTQRIISVMQTPVGAGGALPVDTGFLRASLQASTEAPPQANVQRPAAAAFAPNDTQVSLVIAGSRIGQTIYACYTASYAAHVEYGTSKMPGRGFVRLAAAQWQPIVNSVAEELKGRASPS